MAEKAIQPTVGRVVWYRCYELDRKAPQPEAALIAFVHDERKVNLCVIGHDGRTRPEENVMLVQPGDVVEVSGHFCEWMPFQKGQAAKTDAAEAALAAKGTD